MDLLNLSRTLQQDAVAVVFVNVLLQQMGLPVPAVPTLLLAGSLAITPGHAGKIVAAAVLASVVADWVWYHAGRLFGYRVLTGLCKLSINPTSCVSQAESRFVRWGLPSLVVAKFVPGFSTVAPPIAGALRMNQLGFLLAASVGGALWAGLAIAAGWALKDAVQGVIVVLDRHMATALALAMLAVGTWLAWKLWRKFRFRRLRAIPQITAAELVAAMSSEQPPLVLDLRGPAMISDAGPIPGTRAVEHERVREAVAGWPSDRLIVTLCACPEDAGAILAARDLLDDGFLSVKPLRGGYEAWVAATR
jgi:membrane protein DedA with SNARE-associated domain/rhodanese-related sulfurtransferase